MICHMTRPATRPLHSVPGVIAIPQTAFDERNRVDLDSVARGVADRLAAGVDALLYPVVASEVSRLTPAERRTATLTVLDAAGGRVPVIVGASGDDPATVRLLPILGWQNQHIDISNQFLKLLAVRQGIFTGSALRDPGVPFDAAHRRIAEELVEAAVALHEEIGWHAA